jgi:hypothetical protein
MIPEGFILSDIALAVVIVLMIGSMTLFVLSMCIEQVLNSIIRVKRELLTDEEWEQ